MSDKKRNLLIIINALAWAGAILMVSWYTKGAVDKDTGFTMTMFLWVGWFVMTGFFIEYKSLIKSEIKCLKRLFRIGEKNPD